MVPEEHNKKTIEPANEWDVETLYEFLESVRAKTNNALRMRSEEEIRKNIRSFVTIKQDGNIIACGEIFQTEDATTLELWALAVDEEYKWNWLSEKIIEQAEFVAKKAERNLIIVTNNPVLEKKLRERGYELSSSEEYNWRKQKSPTKNVYVKYL